MLEKLQMHVLSIRIKSYSKKKELSLSLNEFG